MTIEDDRSLLKRTKQLLISRPEPLTQIAKDSNLPIHWLRKFKYGNIKDPSVNSVQLLYEFLTNSQLRV